MGTIRRAIYLPDPLFRGSRPFNNHISMLEETPEGGILAVGQFSTYDGVTVNRIARLSGDGTLDTGFCVGGITVGMPIGVGCDLTTGKIYVWFSTAGPNTINGTSVGRICRLNTDGTVDGTFTPSADITSPFVVDAVSGRVFASNALSSGPRQVYELDSAGAISQTISWGAGISGGGQLVWVDTALGTGVFDVGISPWKAFDTTSYAVNTFSGGAGGDLRLIQSTEALMSDGPSGMSLVDTITGVATPVTAWPTMPDPKWEQNRTSRVSPPVALLSVTSTRTIGGHTSQGFFIFNADGTVNTDFSTAFAFGTWSVTSTSRVVSAQKALVTAVVTPGDIRIFRIPLKGHSYVTPG